MSLLYTLLTIGYWISIVLAQVQPFTVTGFLTTAKPNDGTAVNRGGTVTISGFTVKIPDNLLVQFPALFIPFAEFASADPAQWAGPNEVTINGNIVNNVIIAAQMTVSQLELAFSSGTIASLANDGRITLASGPVLRINDPNAKYSAGYNRIPFFTADDENPSISSFSGVPMCVPRNSTDPLCPSSNRASSGTTFALSDQTHMVPLAVGDYIEYSGVQFDGATIVYNMVVNVGITTSGNQAGFLRMEDAIIGVGSANADLEAARFRFVGYSSRADLPITIWAIDEHPCTGATSDRLIATGAIQAAAVRNKFDIRIAKNADVGKYTRNYRIKCGDNVVTTSDGIDAGQYVQPVTEWILPELITPGATPPAYDFSNIGPLADGFGPIDNQLFGQLSPWPGATAPVPSITSCAPPTSTTTSAATSSPTGPPPVLKASAGANQIVLSGVFVTLKATQLTPNVPESDLRYTWTQTSGDTLTLSSTTGSTINISPPVIASGSAARQFQVVITHVPSGATANATTTVTVNRTTADHPVIDSLTWASKQSGTATASAHTDLVDPAGSMKISFGGTAEVAMGRAATVNGQVLYTFSARSIPKFTTATVRSYINGVLVPGSTFTSTNVG